MSRNSSRRPPQLRHEKEHLEQTLEQEQECLVNKLMNKIQKLESQTLNKQTTLEQLRREKVNRGLQAGDVLGYLCEAAPWLMLGRREKVNRGLQAGDVLGYCVRLHLG